ncbi:hypothetical protein JXE69_000334 [Salmonella enterica subsp. houtenae serovar 17:z29:-]|nr:hypothetical protein [Salmonella enterica subsp. houtenae serovar 17:z29:-]
MATITVHCPRCQSELVYRHGFSPSGKNRFRCRDCHCIFLPGQDRQKYVFYTNKTAFIV